MNKPKIKVFGKEVYGIVDSFYSEHYIFKFTNGYGASILNLCYRTEAMDWAHIWEVGTVIFTEENKWKILDRTPFSEKVFAYMKDKDVEKYLDIIESLEEGELEQNEKAE